MITFRSAIPPDNNQLLTLTNLTPMQGSISICIQREPDFFALLNKRGQPHVIVAEIEGMIAGSVSIVKEEMILMEQPVTFYYLCDLKVHPEHRNKKVATMLTHEMNKYLHAQNADWLLTIVADGNNRVMPLIKGKAGIINDHSESTFIILQLFAKKNKRKENYNISNRGSETTVIEMYKEFYSRYVLHPVVSSAILKSCTHIVAYKNDKPIAAISLYDPIEIKQNVVTGMPWYLEISIWCMRILKSLLSLPSLPHKGQPIKILYVKAFSFLPGHEDAFISLIQHARSVAYQKNYTFLSLTIHEKDHLKKHLKKLPGFAFKSKGMICSLKNNISALNKIKSGNVLEDFSIV